MSVVTGVTLQFKNNYDRAVLVEFNTWLRANGDWRPLFRVEDNYGGTKHPQITVCGAGYNYFHVVEEFIDFFTNYPWDYPENAVLIINPEEGGLSVIRPKGY